MLFRPSHVLRTVVLLLLVGLGFTEARFFGAEGMELSAVSALGKGESAVLQLVRELTEWKARAEAAESLLERSGMRTAGEVKPIQATQAQVVGALEAERIVIVSAGKLSGAVLGSLVAVGEGVVAKIVESRETVSAAVVDQGYRGRIGVLEGSPVRLLVVRP
jgi:hypothetical protein